jgi:hypothetical protein
MAQPMLTVSGFRSGTATYAVVMAMLMTAATAGISAQATPSNITPGRVDNMQVVVSGGLVTVSYDLAAAATPSTFSVTLEASQDGGKTYGLRPQSVTGDVGRGVSAGPGKRIVWDAAKDTDSLQLAQLRFRVVPTAEVPAARQGPSTLVPPPSPASGQNPPAARPVVPVNGTTGGNRMMLPGLAMIGGGAAIGAMGAAGPLKSKDPFYDDCKRLYGADVCSDLVEPNKAIMGAGLGLAAVGAIAILMGRPHAAQHVEIRAVPKGLLVTRAVRF